MKIAIVGSGIAGLSAAWSLGDQHEVTIFERSERLGMDAHSIDLANGNRRARVDVPLRVFFDGFYPTLTALYRELDIAFEPINYAASFGLLTQPTYFRFNNYKLGRHSIPFFEGSQSLNKKGLRIGWDMVRFFTALQRELERGIDDSTTLEAFLAQRNYSSAFADGFLYPAFAGICTCRHESIRAYPARVVLEYLGSGILLSSVQRVTRGTQEVVALLSSKARQVKLSTTVMGIEPTQNGVAVRTASAIDEFDHVLLATQANQSATLLPKAALRERAMLDKFTYETSRVIVHRDVQLAPVGGPQHWAPVNFLLADPQSTPMATIWMNAIQTMPDEKPVFQTWNPIVEPRPDLVVGRADFERPVVTTASLAALQQLAAFHNEPDRRIWFCGSYAAHGIPLLESATRSAMAIAERLTTLSHSY